MDYHGALPYSRLPSEVREGEGVHILGVHHLGWITTRPGLLPAASPPVRRPRQPPLELIREGVMELLRQPFVSGQPRVAVGAGCNHRHRRVGAAGSGTAGPVVGTTGPGRRRRRSRAGHRTYPGAQRYGPLRLRSYARERATSRRHLQQTWTALPLLTYRRARAARPAHLCRQPPAGRGVEELRAESSRSARSVGSHPR